MAGGIAGKIMRGVSLAAESPRLISDAMRMNRVRKKNLPLSLKIKPLLAFAKLGIPPEAKVVFDVGANAGQFALLADKYFYSADIYSFEPVASTFSQLENSVAGKQNIKPYRLGLFSRNGHAEINVTSYSPANSMLNVHPDYDKAYGNVVQETGKKETIEIRTIDSFVEENKIGKIDLLKIDVEGVEADVLLGAKQTLKERVDRVYIEISFVRRGRKENAFLEIYSMLDGLDFALCTISGAEYSSDGNARLLSQFDALFVKKSLLQ